MGMKPFVILHSSAHPAENSDESYVSVTSPDLKIRLFQRLTIGSLLYKLLDFTFMCLRLCVIIDPNEKQIPLIMRQTVKIPFFLYLV